jgi:hypothetical protein
MPAESESLEQYTAMLAELHSTDTPLELEAPRSFFTAAATDAEVHTSAKIPILRWYSAMTNSLLTGRFQGLY